jgi:hypothetical protein
MTDGMIGHSCSKCRLKTSPIPCKGTGRWSASSTGNCGQVVPTSYRVIMAKLYLHVIELSWPSYTYMLSSYHDQAIPTCYRVIMAKLYLHVIELSWPSCTYMLSSYHGQVVPTYYRVIMTKLYLHVIELSWPRCTYMLSS